MLARDNGNLPPAEPNDNNHQGDKRYIPRWSVKNRIFFQVDSEAQRHEACTHDISCAGVSLETDQDLLHQQKINLTVYLSERKSIKVDGRILWNKKTPQGHLIGVLFENIDPESQNLILDYAFEIKREDLVKHWFKGWES